MPPSSDRGVRAAHRQRGAPQRGTGAFSGLRREETIAGYLFLLPNLIGFLIFSLVPIVATFGLTLTDWNLIGERTFVGLENYSKLVGDELFWKRRATP